MDWSIQGLSALGDLVGSAAVLVTLIYVAYQIRQNSIIARTAGQRELLRNYGDWVQLTTTHPDLVNVLRKALADWESATPEEQERANGWMLSTALLAEQAQYLWHDKLMHERSYKRAIGLAVSVASTPGGRKWWSHARNALGDDVSELIDDELARLPADAPSWTDVFPHLRLEDQKQAGR
jgi:hypothetical protein